MGALLAAPQHARIAHKLVRAKPKVATRRSNDSNPKRVKGVLQAMIDGIRMDARDHIEPAFCVVAVRIESAYMGETARRANQVVFEGRRSGSSRSSSRKSRAGAFRPKAIVWCLHAEDQRFLRDHDLDVLE